MVSGIRKLPRQAGFFFVVAPLLILALGMPLRAETGALIQKADQGRINWFTGEMRAIGEAKARQQLWDQQVRQEVMRRQALMQGRRNLYSTLKAVRIDSSLTVRDRVAEAPVLREKLKGRVNNSVVLDRTLIPDERMSLRVGMKLWGPLSKMLIPDSVWYEKPSEVSAEELDKEEMEPSERIERHSGLIVDARGLDVEPSLICRVYGPEKRLLYGPGIVRPSVAIGRGMVGYTQDRRRAVRSSRSGDDPLILRAEEKAASKGCEVTVSAEASEHLLPRPGNIEFMRRGRVIIIVGSSNGDEPMGYELSQ